MPRRIYVASKSKHGEFWRTLRRQGYPICSTWIDEWKVGQTVDGKEFWSRIVKEVSTADALIHLLYSREIPKGALVEVGVALATGVPVFWVGRRYYCCCYRLVTMCASVEDAFCLAKQVTHA